MIAEESDSSQTVLPTRPVFARSTAGIFCVKTVAKYMQTVVHHLSEGTVLPCCQQCPHCNSHVAIEQCMLQLSNAVPGTASVHVLPRPRVSSPCSLNPHSVGAIIPVRGSYWSGMLKQYHIGVYHMS